jgi:hypothetical protein
VTPAAATDVPLDADSFSHRPHLSPTVSDEEDKRPPTDLDAEDKDKDEDEDGGADAGVALLVLLPDVDPPSLRSQQDEQQGTWRLRPQAEDIIQHHPQRSMSRPLRTRTSRSGMRIGMHVIHVVSTSQTNIPVRHALHI